MGLTELRIAEDGLEIELLQRLSVYGGLVRGYMRGDDDVLGGGSGHGARVG